jgi:hypothetical protein
MLCGVMTGPAGGDSSFLALDSRKRHIGREAAAQFTDAADAPSHKRLSFDGPRKARPRLNGEDASDLLGNGYLHLRGYGGNGACHEN